MAQGLWFALPPALLPANRRLVEAFDHEIRAGERRASGHVACRIGCIACCIGPFDVTALDALRLRAGIARLAREAPGRAAGLRRRAAEQWERMATAFPGDATTGLLGPDEAARAAFFARFADIPCPVLEPGTGACLLYDSRPLSCRSFGLPVRVGGELLPPCSLNFTQANADESTAAAVEPDPDDLEDALLAEASHLGLPAGDSIVCAVLVNGTDI